MAESGDRSFEAGEQGAPAESGTAEAARPTLPPAVPPAAGRKSRSRDPRVFVLLRELSEVHLLLDNVSANPTTTVSELTDPEKLRKQKLEENWIESVCKISWPPDGSDEEKAEDAALLIRAKDYLNRLCYPASGSTIAFTLLVTHEESRKERWWRRWRQRTGEGEEAAKLAKKGDNGSGPSKPHTRSSLAETAYPDLVGKAEGFRKAMWWISIGLVVALVVTCALSWYVAYGNAALAELADARQAVAEAQTRVIEAEAGEAARRAEQTRAAAAPSGAAAVATQPPVVQPPGTAPQEPFVRYCRRPPYLQQAQLCDALAQAEARLPPIELRLSDWRCWDRFSSCDDEVKGADAPARAAALAGIMASAVLPFLYGLLGAGAAIIRSLSRKIRASLLSPRDLHLSFQQLALGAVVGACIGLFVVAPGGEGGETVLGPVALSASAISFVAGFGVEAVFQALEALITRIFNITPAPAGNRGDGVASN